MSGTGLKLLAVFFMLLDHIGEVFAEDPILPSGLYSPAQIAFWLRGIGRLSFPIYSFLLTEGFVHTRNRARYAVRLGEMALLSEVPFDLMRCGEKIAWDTQNVCWTLLLGLLGMILIDRFRGEQNFISLLLITAAVCGSAELLRSDYGALGVFGILLLYLLRYDRRTQCYCGSILFLYEIPASLAFLLIRLYNGSRGSGRGSGLFYTVYPLHMLLLAGIRQMLKGSL